MLRQLKIQNLAILPELSVSFGPGLNVLTGETGAGKSILVDAVGLLAGRRSSGGDVRSGEEMAVVEGVIAFAEDSRVWKFLEDAGIPSEKNGSEIVIRRTVSADGRSRAYVNGFQWTVSGLAELAARWIDISGQHGQQRLMDEASHIDLLDTFGGALPAREPYEEAYEEVRSADRQLEELRLDREKAAREKDFLTFQLAELNEVKLVAGEMEELASAHQRSAHGEKLAAAVETVEAALDGEAGASAAVSKAVSELRAASRMDAALASWSAEAEEIAVKIGDLARRASQYREKLDFDPGRIEEINGRLSKLQSVVRKYGSIEKAIAQRERAAALLASIDQSSDREAELMKERETAAARLSILAKKLTDLRKTAAKKFSAAVTGELRKLGMPSAELGVEFVPPVSEAGIVLVEGAHLGPRGAELARLDFAPNPGEGARPLAAIASGGELSRVLLAVKGVAMEKSESDPVTFLFDEVDTGIGGETAERVGIRMRALASPEKGRQVLCVTHLAQIACYANAHLRAEKEVRGGRTDARVRLLDADGRKKELARMMGGIKITDRTLDHAGELLRRGVASPKGL